MKYDLAIIGAGPAGQKAALEAKKRNLNVIIFEKKFMGGTCLNLGCIPTKSILHDIKEKDWKECIERKNSIVKKFNSALEKDFKNKGIEIIFGEATLDPLNMKIECNCKEYLARDIIIATGSKPLELKGLEIDHKTILSSDDLFELQELPKSIAIIGSGAIGIEWARILHKKNIEIFIIEAAQNLLPTMDIDISKRTERIFKIKKIKFFKDTTAKCFKNGELELSTNEKIKTEKVLCAAGRKQVLPKTKNNEIIKINPDFSTDFPHVWGIGDITPHPMLAHSASYQAKNLVKRICNDVLEPIDFSLIPSVIYGEPEIASVGLKEQDITEEDCEIYNMPIARLPKAWCDEQTDGFIKIITSRGIIKGAHIMSQEASALLSSILIAMKAQIPTDELKEIVFPHPTLSEGLSEVFE